MTADISDRNGCSFPMLRFVSASILFLRSEVEALIRAVPDDELGALERRCT